MTEYEAARAVAIAFEARIILADWAASSTEMNGWHLMDVTALHEVCDPNEAFDQAVNVLGIAVNRAGPNLEPWFTVLNQAMQVYEQMWLTDAGSTAH